MKRINKYFAISLFLIMLAALITSCATLSKKDGTNGTTWGTGAFGSNGERIYFTSTSERGSTITYDDGPTSNGWMMMSNGQLACASCHGPDGRGGDHGMGQMQVMTAPDIRWSAIGEEFDAKLFNLAVTKGEDPDGSQLSTDMPRWQISDEDLTDLLDYIKTLP
ncbi:MAG: c-type cytochrome [Anaerolineaceae bacterium]